MANFNRMVVTDLGAALNTRATLEDRKIVFSKIAVGRGGYTTSENLTQKTALKIQMQEIDVSSIEMTDSNTVLVRGVLSNEEVTTAYRLTEIGLYARIGTEEPILYALTVTQSPDEIPVYDSIYPVTITISLHVVLSNTSNIQTTIYSGAYAASRDLIAMQQKNTMLTNAMAHLADVYELQYGTAATPSVTTEGGTPKLLVLPAVKLAFLHGWWAFEDDPSLIGSSYLYLYDLPKPVVEINTRFAITKNASDIVIAYIESRAIPTITGDDNKRGIVKTIGKTSGIYGISLCYPYTELADAHPLSSGTLVSEGGPLPGLGGYELGDLIANDDGAGTITLSIGGES